jgi:hypothetical protein
MRHTREHKKKDPEINPEYDRVISKGGSSALELKVVESTEIKLSWKNINLRLTDEMINEIDRIITTQRIGISRTAWILEAIQEKLRNDF